MANCSQLRRDMGGTSDYLGGSGGCCSIGSVLMVLTLANTLLAGVPPVGVAVREPLIADPVRQVRANAFSRVDGNSLWLGGHVAVNICDLHTITLAVEATSFCTRDLLVGELLTLV